MFESCEQNAKLDLAIKMNFPNDSLKQITLHCCLNITSVPTKLYLLNAKDQIQVVASIYCFIEIIVYNSDSALKDKTPQLHELLNEWHFTSEGLN